MISLEELRSIPRLHKQIERDKEQLRYLREKATAIKSALDIDGERVQTSPENNANKYIEAAVDLDKEIQAKSTELTELQRRAKEFIDTVQDSFANKILKHRYLKCRGWEEIADLLGYDARYLQRIESEATYQLRV